MDSHSIAFAFKNAEDTDSVLDKTIAKLSGSPYSHVELWLGVDTEPPSTALCCSSRGFTKQSGVYWENVDLSNDKLWAIIKINDVTDDQMKFLKGFCTGSCGKAYDYADLLDALHGSGTQRLPWARYCSAFCLEAYQKTFNLLTEQEYWSCSPGKLYKLLTNTTIKLQVKNG